jgi:hypothetical protein
VTAAALAAALLLTGCYGGATSPTPAGPSEIFAELTRNGVAIQNAVAGDAGCDDPTLVDNASHLRVSLPPDSAVSDVYLFTFRTASFGPEEELVDACRQMVASRSTGTVEQLDVPPYRAFGLGWTPALKEALRRALVTAARGGTIDRDRPGG